MMTASTQTCCSYDRHCATIHWHKLGVKKRLTDLIPGVDLGSCKLSPYIKCFNAWCKVFWFWYPACISKHLFWSRWCGRERFKEKESVWKVAWKNWPETSPPFNKFCSARFRMFEAYIRQLGGYCAIKKCNKSHRN